MILLTAIGRTPPFFSDKAVSDALQRAFETNERNLPLIPVFTNLVIALTADSEWSGAVHSTACNRCSGYTLEGPAAKTAKEFDWVKLT